MDISIYGIIRNTLPVIPLAIRTALLSLFGISPNADVQDTITEIITILGRPILGTPASLLKSQLQLNHDYGVWGRMWVSKCCVPSFKDVSSLVGEREGVVGVREALRLAIRELDDVNRGKDSTYTMPEVVDVEAEWVGYRSAVWHTARRPKISEREQYEAMMEDLGVKSNTPTMLYIHGGAMCLMDPVTHRWTTSDLAKISGGRCLSIRYRLSPQNVFPAALMDALMCYLYLISPPPGAFHTPVPPSQIVIAGDSSGAGIGASLLLLLLTLPRIGITHLRVANRDIAIPTTQPMAGLALTSPWLDISRSLPSVTRNASYDIIAIPTPFSMTPNFPKDSVWPTNPPRVETYCEATMVSHPLVSPLSAKQHLWVGAPPLYICVGWEGMQDEAEVFARRFSEAGSEVVFEGFVGMPHCFGMVPWNWMGRRAMKGWGEFCALAVGGDEVKKDWAVWISKDGGVTEVDVERLGLEVKGVKGGRPELDDYFVETAMKEQRRWRLEAENEMTAIWRENNE